MKNSFKLKLLSTAFIFIIFSRVGFSQQTLTTIGGWNAYVHLPASYAANPTKLYPTIIFMPGIGEVGYNAPLVIIQGPGAYIGQGWNGNVTVNNTLVEFIVISLQTPAWPGEASMHERFQLIRSMYRTDPSRFFLTGLSHGGWCATSYVTGDPYGGPYTYAPSITAVATVEGVVANDNMPYPNTMDNYALNNGRYLGLEQVNDYRDQLTIVNRMNTTRPGSGIYVQTYFGDGGHCCWHNFYGGGGIEPAKFMLDGINQNIYEWFARQGGSTNSNNNSLPVSNAGPDQFISTPASSVTLSGSGTDADGTIASYQWTKLSGPAGGTISAATSAVTSVTGLTLGTYQFQLAVTDNQGGIGYDVVNVTVNAGNQPPTVLAGMDQTIFSPANQVWVYGLASDADGTIVSYEWSKISGPSGVVINSPTTNGTSISGLTLGTYQFQLKATDNQGATGTDIMVVTVTSSISVNQSPYINAGNNITITLPVNSATLTGSGTDPDGTVVSYSWAKIAGPSSYTIVSPGAATTNVTGLVQGSYTFQLTVTDNNGASSTDDVQVTVNQATVNQPPVVNAGADQTIAYPNNTVFLTANASDPDGTISTIEWTKISGANNLIFSNPYILNTSVTSLTQGIYVLQLKVTDNRGAAAYDTIQITVTGLAIVNPAPTANAGEDKTITLPVNSVTLNGSGTDVNGTIVSYAWTKISGPASFTIVSPNAASTNITGLAQGVYIFQLKVVDNQGASATDNAIVTVNPAGNQLPVVYAGVDQTIGYPFNTVFFNGSATDPDGTIATVEWRKISGSNNLIISNPYVLSTAVTALTQGVYQFQLKVTDNQGAVAVDTLQVTVNGTNNQLPSANAGVNQVITLPVNTALLTGSGTDPDGSIVSYSWSKISGPSSFTITTPNAASTSVTNLVQGVYQFSLTVTDNSGATASATVTVTVNAATVVNQAPVVNAGPDVSIQLPVNSALLSGTSSDADGWIVSNSWQIVSGTGAQIANAASLVSAVTFSQAGTFIFRLTATDNSGAVSFDDVTVKVNDAVVNNNDLKINVNIFDGSIAYSNTAWNNWQPVTEAWSQNYNYANGSASTVSAKISASPRFVDNGPGYASTATMCPAEVLRINSIASGRRTLTLRGLAPGGIYDFDFFASRAYNNNKTLIIIGNLIDTISTDYNLSDFAHFTNITADRSGTVEVIIDNVNVFNYLAGFTITKRSTTNRSSGQPASVVAQNSSPMNKTVIEDVQPATDADVAVAFPNPFKEQLNITLGSVIKGNYSIQIFSTNGELRLSKKGSKSGNTQVEKLPTTALSAGVYIVQLVANGVKQSFRVVKY